MKNFSVFFCIELEKSFIWCYMTSIIYKNGIITSKNVKMYWLRKENECCVRAKNGRGGR